jgi:hypothetical protein
MSQIAHRPPIRIHRDSPRAARPPAQPPAKPAAPAAKPKGPAFTPRKPVPRVENPARIRDCKENSKVPSKSVSIDPYYGSPFRTRQVDGQWFAVWTGDKIGLADDRKPAGWKDILCQSQRQAASLCLAAYRSWILEPRQAKRLATYRARLRGFNLRCRCPVGYPCHGDILLELVNGPDV